VLLRPLSARRGLIVLIVVIVIVRIISITLLQ